jgi:hypothetical protein
MTLGSILEDAVATLRRTPHVLVESALVLPGRPPEELKDYEARTGLWLPPCAVQLYTQLGGAHISWRLSPEGYEKLEPGRTDNKHRYDVSGNLDILPLEEIDRSLTGQPWEELYTEGPLNYRPVDFSSLFVNMGFTRSADGWVLFILYENRQVPLGLTMTEYLRRGAELLFLNDWQLGLPHDEESVKQGERLRSVRQRLASWPAP